jgi:capsular exopolysaccharide synthesis family protein
VGKAVKGSLGLGATSMAAASGDRPDSKANPPDSAGDWNVLNGAPAIAAGYPPEGRQPAVSSSLNPEGLVKALQRRWLLATTLGLICGGLAAAAGWFFLPPTKPTARTLVRVSSLSQFLISPIGDQRADFVNFQRSQIALVKRREVLEKALNKEVEVSSQTAAANNKRSESSTARHDVETQSTAANSRVGASPKVRQLSIFRDQDEPVDWLERELKVDYTMGPEILSISLSGDNPDDLKIVVNAIREVYMEENEAYDQKTREKKMGSLTSLFDAYASRVQQYRDLLAKISNNHGDPKNLRTLNDDLLAQIKNQLLAIGLELKKLKAEAKVPIAIPSDQEETEVPDKVVEDYLKTDAGYKDLLTKKSKLDTDLEQTRRLDKRGEKSPQIQKYNEELRTVLARIEARRKEVRPQIIKEYQAKIKADAEMNQLTLKKKITSYEQLQKSLEEDQKNLEQNTIGLGALQNQLLLQQVEDIAKRIAAQKEAMFAESKAPSRVTELQPAYIVRPDETKRKIVAAGMSGFGTLGLILFLVAWMEYRPRRIHSVDEVQDLGMKLVGTVPALPSRRQLRLLNVDGNGEAHWQSILTESVDTARTIVLHTARSEQTQIVMVTSATGGEGKTSLSSHLAASLARSGRKTLLLDCDLRNPALHRVFGTSRSPGLCEVLRGETELAEVIWQTPAPGLWMVPAGRCDNRALQALAQDHFKKIAGPLRAGYDFIVVDSAPVLPVADSLLIAQSVDAVIFSILHEVSRLPKVYAAHQRLEMLGIRLLGAVVSGTHVDTYAPEYQYLTQLED